MAHRNPFTHRPSQPRPAVSAGVLVAVLVTLASPASAQQAPAPSLPEVRVGARAAEPATERAAIGGLSDAPLAETPQSVTVIRSATLRDAGATSLSQAIRSETSAADAYNTIGYVESLQIRGFLLDNAQNYRRDGFVISNHAPVALENKEAIEILKGVSGIQSGVSAPGGLVNYVLKRPTATPLRDLYLGVSERGSTRVHGDLGGRLGEAGRIGYRINLAGEARRPMVDDARGNREFLSGFFDMRLPNSALLEAEFEHNSVRQRSVPGFSLLDRNGDGIAESLPAPVNPRLNLGSQPWATPFESRATAATLRFQQALSAQWIYGLRYGIQRIRTHDRLAFPDGCSSAANYVYPGFCGNGDFDVYDYRSDNELRTTNALEAWARGEFATGPVRHELSFGVKRIRYEERYEPMQAYNWVGVSNMFAPVTLPGDPTPTSLNTLRDATTNEVFLHDTMRWGAWSLWLGARHTNLDRSSERTDGSRALAYRQSFTAPWAALGWQPWQGGFGYVSAGSGVETEAVPNRPSVYANYGEVLPALRSRQVEAGFRQSLAGAGLASVTLFQIMKPFADDIAQPGGTLVREAGAREARHRGLELAWSGLPIKTLSLRAALTLIDAEITKSPIAEAVGRQATNVAPYTASVQAGWQVPNVDGLVWNNRLFLSGRKPVTPDNAVELPTFWQWDSALVWRTRVSGQSVTLRAGIDNVLDRRYWREAPTQYWGGIYLFPAMPRTLRASAQFVF